MDVLQNNRTPNKNGFLQLNPLAGPRCGDAGEANFGFAASFPLLRMLQSGTTHHDLDKSKSWSCLTLLRSFTKNFNFLKSCFEDTKKFKARFPSLSRKSQRGTRKWWRRCQTEREIETLNVTDKLSGWQILGCLWCGLLGKVWGCRRVKSRKTPLLVCYSEAAPKGAPQLRHRFGLPAVSQNSHKWSSKFTVRFQKFRFKRMAVTCLSVPLSVAIRDKTVQFWSDEFWIQRYCSGSQAGSFSSGSNLHKYGCGSSSGSDWRDSGSNNSVFSIHTHRMVSPRDASRYHILTWLVYFVRGYKFIIAMLSKGTYLSISKENF